MLGSQNFSILHTSHPPFQWNIVLLTIKKHNKDIPNTTGGGSHKEQVQAHVPSHLPGISQRSRPFLAILHSYVTMLVYQKEKNLPSINLSIFVSVTGDDHLMSKMFLLSVILSQRQSRKLCHQIFQTQQILPVKHPQIDGLFLIFFTLVQCSISPFQPKNNRDHKQI